MHEARPRLLKQRSCNRPRDNVFAAVAAITGHCRLTSLQFVQVARGGCVVEYCLPLVHLVPKAKGTLRASLTEAVGGRLGVVHESSLNVGTFIRQSFEAVGCA